MAELSEMLVHIISRAKGREFESQSLQRKLGNKIIVLDFKIFAVKSRQSEKIAGKNSAILFLKILLPVLTMPEPRPELSNTTTSGCFLVDRQ